MNFIKIMLLLSSVGLSPAYAYASGGGPVLLLFNGSVFIIGLIWITAIEFFIYRKFTTASKEDALKDVISTNIFSTALISFGIPLLIAIIGLVGNFLPGTIGKIISAIGTWVVDNAEYNTLAVYMALIWFVVLSVMTVFFEAYILKKRWTKRSFDSGIKPITLSWYTNAVSHLGLFVAVLFVWRELIFA